MPGRGTGSIFKRGDTYYASYANGKRQVRVSTGTSDREDALAFLQARLAEIRAGLPPPPERLTVADLLEAVIVDYIQRDLKSIYDLKRRVRGILIPRIGSVKARAWRLANGNQYVQRRKTEQIKPATIRRELAVVKRAFSLAVHQELLVRMPSFPELHADNVREGFLEHAQYQALLAALPTHLRALYVMGYHTGIRRGALLQIEAGMVDVAADTIRIPGRILKNKKPVMVPIYGDMRPWVEMLVAGKTRSTLLFDTIGDFRKAWATACKKAGLDGLLFHDMRRTAVRNLSRAGVPEKVIMAIIGHKTRSIFDRYNIVSEQDVKSAGEKMERYLAGQESGVTKAREQ